MTLLLHVSLHTQRCPPCLLSSYVPFLPLEYPILHTAITFCMAPKVNADVSAALLDFVLHVSVAR